jgi:hypothetical protein
MIVKEKFKQWLDTKPNVIFRDTQLEKIADDYAVEFANWLFNINKEVLIKQLKEFKKEKGL